MHLFFSYLIRIRNFFSIEIFTENKYWRTLSFILFIGFIVRVAVCFFASLPHMHTDSFGYFEQAEAILQSGYVNYFPNGYPFIIAFFKLLSNDHIVSMLLWLNILLSVCTIFFISEIARILFKSTAIAILASFILAVFPTQINYVRWLLTEVPTTFFLLGFYFFYLKNKNWYAGIFFGIATVIRTEVIPILLLILFLELIFRKRFRLAMLVGFLIPVITISTYCYVKTGEFSMAGHSRVNILYSITSSGGYVDWYYQDKHPEVKTSKQAMEMYFEYMMEDPLRYFKNRMANLWELWGFFPSSSDGSRSFLARISIGLINFFLVFLGFYGWWLNRRKLFANLLMIPFLVVTAVHTVLLTLPRYTYTVEPFLIVFVAFTINQFLFPKRKIMQ